MSLTRLCRHPLVAFEHVQAVLRHGQTPIRCPTQLQRFLHALRHVVGTQGGTDLFGRLDDPGERRDVPVHREDPVGDDEDQSVRSAPVRTALGGSLAEDPAERLHIAVRIDEPRRLREAHPVDDRGVVQRVRDDQVGLAGHDRDHARIRGEARLEGEDRLAPLELGERRLELLVEGHRPGDRPDRAAPRPEAGRRLGRRADHPRVVSEPEIVVRGEADHPSAVDDALRALDRAHHPERPIESVALQSCELLAEEGERVEQRLDEHREHQDCHAEITEQPAEEIERVEKRFGQEIEPAEKVIYSEIDINEKIYDYINLEERSIKELLDIWKDYQRAEPLFYIALKYREAKQFDLGYIFAKKASKINLSFQYSNWEEDVYQWKILDELSVCAYWTKKYRESFSISKKILSLVPISEQPRVKNNINYCRPYLPKKTKIKFKEKINPALAEAIAHLSLSSSNIIEVNRSDNGITGIICHYAPEKVTHVFVNRSKQIIKSVFKKIKEKKLNKPSYKLFNQLVFVPNNIDFLILNDTKKTSEKTLETLWDKIKSEGKILISNKSYLKYINEIKTAYPDYKESGYALIIKN